MRYVDRHRSVSGWTLQSLFCSHASSKIVRIKQSKENESGIFNCIIKLVSGDWLNLFFSVVNTS